MSHTLARESAPVVRHGNSVLRPCAFVQRKLGLCCPKVHWRGQWLPRCCDRASPMLRCSWSAERGWCAGCHPPAVPGGFRAG